MAGSKDREECPVTNGIVNISDGQQCMFVPADQVKNIQQKEDGTGIWPNGKVFPTLGEGEPQESGNI